MMKRKIKDHFLEIATAIGFIILALALSWAIEVALIKLITLCFGWKFSIATATGIWLIMSLIKAHFSQSKKKE